MVGEIGLNASKSELNLLRGRGPQLVNKVVP